MSSSAEPLPNGQKITLPCVSLAIVRCLKGVSCSVLNAKLRLRKPFLWPAAAVLLGALAAANPYYTPNISLHLGIAAWCADMVLVLVLWAHPITARAGVLMAGLFLAVPCFLYAPPLFRGLLMCLSFIPLAIAAMPMVAPQLVDARSRFAFMCSWGTPAT